MPQWIMGVEVATSLNPPKGESCVFYFMKNCEYHCLLRYLVHSCCALAYLVPNPLTARVLAVGIRD